MPKTYSQKVARVFEIVGYILLIPTFISLIYPLVCFISGIASGRSEVFIIGLAPLTIAGIGMILLLGYFRHSRGSLDKRTIPVLWITTAVYNFLLFLPALYYVSSIYQSLTFKDLDSALIVFFLIYLAVILGYILAIVFSLKAYSVEKRINISKFTP